MAVYPVVVYKDTGSDFGTIIPDLPGCVSAGESLEIAIQMTHEAVRCHLEGMAKDGEVFPEASDIEAIRNDAEYATCHALSFVEVDLSELSADTERVNITLPRWLISAIDKVERNRSRFLAESAIKALQDRQKRDL